jgi:hypothetical protein
MTDTTAVILGFFILLASLTKLLYHVRPKKSFAQINLAGITDQDGEQMHLTATLFDDETVDQWQQKILKLCELREWRLKMQNARMLKVHEDARKNFEAAKQEKLSVVSDKA